ncbi:MAG TPA: rhodanese-like domain-containing protein [Anaeromyxobacteraceae bacterium]|nr:rhodanese-like domain-containing protein [Anaeromyxobacteraceae bacterium]
MKKVCLAVASMLAVGFSLPARSAEQVDPAVLAAAEKMLSTMPNDWYQVEPAAAQQLVENAKPLVLDMREPNEIATRIAGSVNIPIRQLPKQLAQLPENRAAPILTYCKVGYRGGMAVTILRMLGYTNVRTIKFGLDAWEKAGLPVEKVEKKS